MPVVKYHCSKCGSEFELVRPPSKVTEYMPCPKCSKPCSPASSFGGSPMSRSAAGETPVRGRELPPWARGQVEAQVRQLVGSGDAIGGQEVDLISQEVLRELAASSVEITPANIRLLAQKHLSELDSWARTARRAGAKLDAADKLDDED